MTTLPYIKLNLVWQSTRLVDLVAQVRLFIDMYDYLSGGIFL